MAQQSDFFCFLIRNQYSGGNIYWHGFSEKKAAQEFAAPFADLDVKSSLHCGIVDLSEIQARECRGPKGCVFDERQIKQLKEVGDEAPH